MLTTTKRLLRKYHACENSYKHLLASLGSPLGENEPITLLRILQINGLADAIWALRAIPQTQCQERDRLARLFACACVRQTPLTGGGLVWNLLTANSRHAVKVAELFAKGKATAKELAAAWDAAGAAAGAAAWTAARDAQEKIFKKLIGDENETARH